MKVLTMTELDMKKIQEEAFWNSPLDEEEQQIEDRREEFQPAPEWVGKSLREAAKNPPVIHRSKKPKKAVTIRIDEDDINLLKSKALEQGLQYQSLVCSVLHRYASDALVDVEEVKKVVKLQ